MATKIILFLSKLGDDNEQEYICPDGGTVMGSQTNEAPVKYLLRAWPETSELICIVTPEAEDAREWCLSEIKKLAAKLIIHNIPYDSKTDFTTGPLNQIIQLVNAGDTILLDTTGGFRNAVMDLLLTSRVLSYIGVKTACAVYSNQYTRQIEDITHMIGTFDLIGGMQEFTSFGSTRTLRAYYGTPAADGRIEKLLTTVEHLLDCITLCRTEQLEALLADFEAALTDAESCDDVMLRMLLPAFRKKYGKKLRILGLIRWCIDSDMLQQALTIYKERIPAYLMNRADLLTMKPGASREGQKDYQSEEEAVFVKQFIDMGKNTSEYRRLRRQIENLDAIPFALEELWIQLPYSHLDVHCSRQQFSDIVFDYFYIRALRNMTNHANESSHAEYMARVLTDHHYPRFQDLTTKDVTKILETALEHLRKENYK